MNKVKIMKEITWIINLIWILVYLHIGVSIDSMSGFLTASASLLYDTLVVININFSPTILTE